MPDIVVFSEQGLVEALVELDHSEVSFDTETSGLIQETLEITGISFSDGTTKIYAPIDSSLNVKKVKCMTYDEMVPIVRLFLKAVGLQVAWNWVFDARVLHKYGINLINSKRADARIASHLLNELNSPHRLKDMAEGLLGLTVTRFKEVEGDHYCDEFYKYGMDDALFTMLLWREFKQQLEDEKLSNLFWKIEMPFQSVLLEMSLEGVLIDKELMIKTTKELHKEYNELIFHMCRVADVKYEVMADEYGSIEPYMEYTKEFKTKPTEIRRKSYKFSTKNLADIFNKLKIPIKAVTPTGAPSIGKETMTALMKTGDNGELTSDYEFVLYLHKMKVIKQLLGLFFTPLPSHMSSDGKVYPSFNDAGTMTGRLSSNGPNVQQLAKPICEYCGGNEFKDGRCEVCDTPMRYNLRSCFIAPEGYKMFSADYSGQEVAVMAQVSRDPTLVKALRNGYDMHLAIANQFYKLGIPEEALSKTHKDYKSYKSKFKNQRTHAKTITFGLSYGKSAYGFAKDFGIDEDEAQKIVDDYFNGMPLLKEAIDQTHKELIANGSVVCLSGRRRHFIRGPDGFYPGGAYRQSFNFKIQGFSADMIRGAAVNVFAKKRGFPHWDLKQIMTVHDENVYIVKSEFVDEATAVVKQCFEDVCRKFVVPVECDIEVGDSYGSAK